MSTQVEIDAAQEPDLKPKNHPRNGVALCPSLYQINTRVLMHELGSKLGRLATLDDIPDEDLDTIAQLNFDWVWFLGVWQTGAAGRKVSRENKGWIKEFNEFLPDFAEEDVCGSCFAVVKYQAHRDFGGNAALDRLRDRIHARGMKLLLDFVPNHTALDHGWVTEHPEFYVHGTEDDLRNQPQNYIRIGSGAASAIFAYGRDPYFDGWPDTVQLNYAEPSLQEAMIGELNQIANHCDGVRCDMAMLVLPDVFERTWGRRPELFWPRAIQSVRKGHPGFLFMAEVYWNLEWTLQQQGFSYTYDKLLYDRLREGHATPVRDHFRADMDYQMKSARFLENHDEPRAAAVFPLDQHRAAAVLTFLCPGLRFFHEGQFQGRKKKVPVHLDRRPDEPVDLVLLEFYEHLLACVNLNAVRNGAWSMLEGTAAWEGNWTSDCFVCFAWSDLPNDRLLVVVNFAPNQSQCRLRLPYEELLGRPVVLEDLMGHAAYERDGTELYNSGMFLDLGAWGYHVFRVKTPPQS
ncbi:MAG TPA: alpha-amylase family glycosyl hydrolase [Acidobacteriaceae bacterium]|nr:alpha-amylase family glycosyl hydrolase [Acidobacteriaceae bacterium]